MRYIEQTYIETEDFTGPDENLSLEINLNNNQQVTFIAEKEFYIPRRISTNKTEVVKLENIVEYTPNNIAIIKMQNGESELTKPQYYLNSIIRDVYKIPKSVVTGLEIDTQIDTTGTGGPTITSAGGGLGASTVRPIDNYFTELDDELAIPEYIGTDTEKRRLALNSLLNLEDLAAAAAINDPTMIDDATSEIDNNFSDMAGLDQIKEVSQNEITTLEEDDQLAVLDSIGLTDSNLSAVSDISDDIIDNPPEVNLEDVIQFGTALPNVAGVIQGLETVNRGIDQINTGVQTIESSMRDESTTAQNNQCTHITVAAGKKSNRKSRGFSNAGSGERKILRKDIETKLQTIKSDIAKQQTSSITILKTESNTPTLVKIARSTRFKLNLQYINTVGSFDMIKSCIATVIGSEPNITIPSGHRPMTKDEVLQILNKTKEELEKLLAQGC